MVEQRRWVWWLGLRRREGRWVRYALNRWGVVWLAVLFIGVNLGMMEYSKTPTFCASCHTMEPYYEAWRHSTHGDVACVKCHIPPGLAGEIDAKRYAIVQVAKTLVGIESTNPHAHVEDAACLRSGCHVEGELAGPSDWTVRASAGNDVTIRFDHTPHLDDDFDGMSLRCVSCHAQIEVETHMAVTLDGCFLCHLQNVPTRDTEVVATCTTCHDSPSDAVRLPTGDFLHAAYIERGVSCENCHSNVIGGRGTVAQQYCWSCHNRREDIEKFDDVAFLHQTHVSDHKVECITCHERIVHRLDAALWAGPMATFNSAHTLDSTGECGACHSQLHGPALAIYSGTGGAGVPDMPSPMYRAQVECIACHRAPEGATDHAGPDMTGFTFRATEAACDYCHHDEYPGRLDEWRHAIDRQLDTARTAFAAAEAALANRPLHNVSQDEAQRWLDDARHNLRLVEAGPGVHNIHYATALLNVTIDNSRRIIAATDAPPSPDTEAR